MHDRLDGCTCAMEWMSIWMPDGIDSCIEDGVDECMHGDLEWCMHARMDALWNSYMTRGWGGRVHACRMGVCIQHGMDAHSDEKQ